MNVSVFKSCPTDTRVRRSGKLRVFGELGALDVKPGSNERINNCLEMVFCISKEDVVLCDPRVMWRAFDELQWLLGAPYALAACLDSGLQPRGRALGEFDLYLGYSSHEEAFPWVDS